MAIFEVAAKVWSVGVVDWDLRWFHGPTYSAHRGTSYNSYLVTDEKTALVDGVYTPFADEFIANIRRLVSLDKIDYLIVNHIEPDHSGALPALMEFLPGVEVICTAKAKAGLEAMYGADWNFRVVKTGDSVCLGSYNLQFIEAPMLHWPDSMFTYLPEQSLLLPNDAFGQHLASSSPFDDQNDMAIVMAEAAKYYANILSPFSKLVLNKLEEIEKMKIDIKIIAPSHGVIWRSNPAAIVQAYQRWASGQSGNGAVVVYDSMWGATEKMARKIVDTLASAGVPVRLYKMSASDRNDIIRELQDSQVIIVGSSTINNDILPVLAPLLEELKGLKPVNKLGAAFGAHGWRGGAVEHIEEILGQAGIKLAAEGLKVQWTPDEEALSLCQDWTAKIIQVINA